MSDETVVGAVRVSDARPGSVIAGSTKEACADCGAEVWVAPSSRKILAGEGAVLCCLKCCLARMGRDGEAELVPLNKEQAAEIAGHLGRN